MKDNYNSFEFWTSNVNEHNNIRGHVFAKNLPTSKSVYVHSLIFSNKNGIENVYSYFPNIKALLGYIQHSFLQKAFYNWAYGTQELIMKIPPKPTADLINSIFSDNKIDKDELKLMKKQYGILNNLWDKDDDEIIRTLIRFCREFNKIWVGDNTRFLYIKIFKSAKELGEFVAESIEMTNKEQDFKDDIGVSIQDWRKLCSEVGTNNDVSKAFRKILLNKLSKTL